MSREREIQLVQRLVDAVHAGKAIDEADWDELVKFSSIKNELSKTEEWFIYVYNSDWHGFGQIDDFPFSAIHLDDCIEHYIEELIEYDDEDALISLRGFIEPYPERDSFFLREIVASDGSSAWVLVSCLFQGKGFEENIEGLFPTPLAAEMSLRADGYIFGDNTPSGIDDLADDQIIKMMQQGDNVHTAMRRLSRMKIDELVILMEREGSSMASTWNEYLCLKRITHDEFELSIRMYEGLGEADEFYDEELEDYILPDSIDGDLVVGMNDGIIFGGELICWDDEQVIKFSDLNSFQVRSWLKVNGYDYKDIAKMISEAVVSST